MLIAFVLVCSLHATPELRDCDRSNARHVIRVPDEFLIPSQCFMRGQAYLAHNDIGQNLTKEEVVKVVCRPAYEGTVG
jgi:hypothetical protein